MNRQTYSCNDFHCPKRQELQNRIKELEYALDKIRKYAVDDYSINMATKALGRWTMTFGTMSDE